MMNRHALQACAAAALLLTAWGCATPAPSPTPTRLPDTPTPLPTATFTPAPTATPTPLGCLTQPGRLEEGQVEGSKSPQLYMIYLPPCYDVKTEERYPALYLLHGQTFTDDQWVRLGAVDAANRLILSGEAVPFIIVFPDDRYWNLPPGESFGRRLVEEIIPYIDAHYRTLDDREHRALGGLSRGGGWTARLGLTHYQMFGSLGLHSPAVFKEDAPNLDDWMAMIPKGQFPRVWLDIGDRDKELGYARIVEDMLSRFAVGHEFHLYSGDHTENYWVLHVEEYLRWYAEGWKLEPVE